MRMLKFRDKEHQDQWLCYLQYKGTDRWDVEVPIYSKGTFEGFKVVGESTESYSPHQLFDAMEQPVEEVLPPFFSRPCLTCYNRGVVVNLRGKWLKCGCRSES